MRRPIIHRGRVSVQTLVIGTATLVGGALAIPSFVKLGDQATLTTVAPSQPAAMEQETQATARPWPGLAGIPAAADASPEIADEPASQSAPPEKPLATASPARDASGDVAGNRSVDPPSIRKVEVFYATDRHLYKATDLHLWITTLVPAGLAVLISSLTIAGAVFGRRRWWWGGAALISLCVSFLVCGQAVIKSSTLTRLAKEDSAWFSSRRKPMTKDYPLNLGTSQVSIPPVHRPGQIESPSVWLLEFREDEGRHLMIQRIEALDATSFYSKLDQRIARDVQASAMIYIHGFNVAFDEALRRTAQLSVDIGFSGAPILYSWPSRGQLTWYRSDQDDADWSAAHLERFLADIRQRTGVKKLHLIAHSMGNRTLVGGLELLGLRYPRQQPMINQIVMAAPDLDSEEFAARYAEGVERCGERTTIYTSSTDRALIASVKVNGQKRLGLVSAIPSVTDNPDFDFVDVTPIDTSLLGHSYYGNHPLMIQELGTLLRGEIRPEQRHWLTIKNAQQRPPIWHFVPQLAKGVAAQR
jgi:esterase/lipase superfamily enzyme